VLGGDLVQRQWRVDVREADPGLDLLDHHGRQAVAQVKLQQHEIGGITVGVDRVDHA
jgi:hypothetical protein